jgi:hypothetical protein
MLLASYHGVNKQLNLKTNTLVYDGKRFQAKIDRHGLHLSREIFTTRWDDDSRSTLPDFLGQTSRGRRYQFCTGQE